MPKINSLEVVHQDTNKDSYQNLHDILVALNKSLALEKEVVDGDARASIENLLEMYANDKEAFLRSLQTLTAQFKASEAKYEEEILLQASALEALAKKTTTLTAQTENNLASVREYSEAVASEVERKVSTYSQDEPPTENLTYGDLWYDTNDNNKLYRWNGLAWIDRSDSSSLESFINGQYATDYAAIEAQVDSKAETWFQTTDPSTTWTTQPIRDQHDKDLWYNSSTKLLKVYVASTNTWTTVEDQAAVDAATTASNAQDTADGKITTFIQTTAPTAEGVGDLWLDSDDNRKMYRWNGSSWVAVDDTRIATTYARWGVQVDSNGYVAGIQLNSDSTGTSEFTVKAANFNVIRPNGTMGLYWDGSQLVVKGDIYANTFYGSAIGSDNIIDGAVNTPEIAANAVSLTSSAVGSTVTPLSTAWTTLAQFTTSTPNATIQNLINCNGRVGLTSGDPAASYYECAIYAGATQLFTTGEAPFLSAFFSFSYLHSTSTAQTYYLKIRTTTSLPSSAALGAMTRMGTKR